MDNVDTAIIHRVQELNRLSISFTFDDHPATGFEGDSILVAILNQFPYLRKNEFSHQPHSGFCLMGACQDCWVWNENGERIRSCSTPLQSGMTLYSQSPLFKGVTDHDS
ncbi:(2Fe-2S)-binding protein [Vibrio salinus]|uniref:(2Fe-2S)-binding protein n=1 Tax=Vibrio salinus TaxID=2899784 RepID=UPI001E2C5170|nr:(2Fe-2S)-binding protein [Vibrio salinus]MCE0495264.1 (2Fe-2S)-binding protein [Vibrio salinus]